MTRVSGQVLDEFDRPVQGAQVYVLKIDGTQATLTVDGGGPLVQPINTDTFGSYYYNTADAIYRREIWYGGKKRWVEQLTDTALDAALRTDIAASTGSGLIGFIQAFAGAVFRTLQDRMRERVSALDFGASPAAVDNYAAITAALATGKDVRLVKTAAGSQYNIATGIALTGNMGLVIEDGVVLHYTGTTGAAVSLSGNNNYLRSKGEINAPLAPYAARFFNLQYSRIDIRRLGSCTTACLFHDAAAQTVDEGNNRFVLGDIQAGSVPYAIKLDSHATFTNEGNTVDLIVALSATTCAIVIGTAGNNTCRYNELNVSVDAQGITPMLVDVYNNNNGIRLRNWAGTASPPIAHVRFNTGTVGNYLHALPGVQNPLIVLDSGTNNWDVPGTAGERLFGGLRSFLGKFGYGAGGAATQATSKSTGVTLNTLSGQITLNGAALAASTSVGFTLTNSQIAATDIIIVNIGSGATAASYVVGADAVAAGSCRIHLRNVSAGSLSEALVLNFNVIKGANS